MRILCLNSGSSSLKYALYSMAEERVISKGGIDDLHHFELPQFDAIGHRLVQGGIDPCLIDNATLNHLKKLTSLDSIHLPKEVMIIEYMQKKYPHIPQVACFDTFFHKDLPFVAQFFAIPRKFWHLKRKGFHGLSYEYVLSEVQKKDPRLVSEGKIVIAHLGSGASMAAISKGKCIDTSMGLTPLGGLIMGTRPGDLDPGVILTLQKELSHDELSDVFNKQSGLLGISEQSSDMRDLLKSNDTRAKEAIDLFCYQIIKFLGAYQMVLGGLDCLVFTGGIGENCPEVRDRITSSLSDEKVWVIPTNEELILARHTYCLLKNLFQ